MCLALPCSPASLGAESLLLPCFWHLYPRKTDGFAFPRIHPRSQPTYTHTHAYYMHTLVHI